MSIGLLALTALALGGAGWLLHSFSRTAALERQEYARLKQATTDSHLIELRTQADAHRREVSQLIQGHRRELAVLCQRIQAPVEAIVEHQQDQSRDGEHVLPLTDAEAAELQDPVLAAHIAELERIERLETGGIFP